MALNKKQQPDLTLILATSGRLRQLLMLIHVIAISACWMAALPIAIKGSLTIGVGVHLLWCYRRFNQCWQIKHSDNQGWQVCLNNYFVCVQIMDSTVVTSQVIFLHFTCQNRKTYHLMLLNDVLDKDQYRQFSVRLKTSHSK